MTDRQDAWNEPNDYEPVSCSLYDYIEMACLYEYELLLTLKDGSSHTGVAKNTRLIKGKGEFIQIHVDEKLMDIRLDALSSIEPQTSNAQFGRISFATNI